MNPVVVTFVNTGELLSREEDNRNLAVVSRSRPVGQNEVVTDFTFLRCLLFD